MYKMTPSNVVAAEALLSEVCVPIGKCVYYSPALENGKGLHGNPHYIISAEEGLSYKVSIPVMHYLASQMKVSWSRYNSKAPSMEVARQFSIEFNRAMQNSGNRSVYFLTRRAGERYGNTTVHSATSVCGPGTTMLTMDAVVSLFTNMTYRPLWKKNMGLVGPEKVWDSIVRKANTDNVGIRVYTQGNDVVDAVITLPLWEPPSHRKKGDGKRDAYKGAWYVMPKGLSYNYYPCMRVIYSNLPKSKVYMGFGYHALGVESSWVPFDGMEMTMDRHAPIETMRQKTEKYFNGRLNFESWSVRCAKAYKRLQYAGQIFSFHNSSFHKFIQSLDKNYPATVTIFNKNQPSEVSRERLSDFTFTALKGHAEHVMHYGDKIAQSRCTHRQHQVALSAKICTVPKRAIEKFQFTQEQYNAELKKRQGERRTILKAGLHRGLA